MTLGNEYALFTFLLPAVLLAGMILGQRIVLRLLASGFHGYERPSLRLSGRRCRVVSEEEYKHLRAWCQLDYQQRN